MSEYADLARTALKQRNVQISIAVTVVVLLVWFIAFFLPQGKKVSTLNAQAQALQGQVAQGVAKVAALRHTAQQATALTNFQKKLESYVPSKATTYDYIKTLSDVVASANATLTSVTAGAPKQNSGAAFTTIPIILRVTCTYDALLEVISKIYALPRLTDIQTLSISGGGGSGNRTTVLSASLALQAFTTASPQKNLK